MMTKSLLTLMFFLKFCQMDALGCDCDGSSTLEAHLAGSTRVFIARVISVEPNVRKSGQTVYQELFVKLKIDTVFKGPLTGYIKIRTKATIASCGYPFLKGRTYVIYAFTDHGIENVSYCSKTQPIEDAYEDISKLKALKKTKTKS